MEEGWKVGKTNRGEEMAAKKWGLKDRGGGGGEEEGGGLP